MSAPGEPASTEAATLAIELVKLAGALFSGLMTPAQANVRVRELLPNEPSRSEQAAEQIEREQRG